MNLTAPVIQLQVIVTLVLAVAILHEPCTVLQMLGGLFILGGSLITQRQPLRSHPANLTSHSSADGTLSANVHGIQAPAFVPRQFTGYLFPPLAALAFH